MKRRISIFALVLLFAITVSACSNKPSQADVSASPEQAQEKIYLYGEVHAEKKILDKEFEIWQDCYQNKNMRHLFVELAYYTAEYLNIWMQSDSDEIIDQLYNDWDGSSLHNTVITDFYKKIKAVCPETIFHGTDVGHCYDSTGKRYLKYLEDNSLRNSEQYSLAQEAMEQGRYYSNYTNHVYRENKMVENFIREFDKLSGESIMGIYGGAHTELDAMDFFTKSVPCMANQLNEHYGDALYSEDLTYLTDDPIRVDTIEVNGKEYSASYFGKVDMSWCDGYIYREFWRLENAYDDFKNNPKKDYYIPNNNYPMQIKTGQVFVIDQIKIDGSVERGYYRSDGSVYDGDKSTDMFIIE